MPNAEHFDRFFLFASVGLGLVVAGGVNLAVGSRSGRRVALQAVVGLLACGAVFAALDALTRGELAARAAGLLGGLLFATAAAGSEWLRRTAAVLFRPAVRWGLLSVGGLALLIGSVVGFERADEAEARKDTLELEVTVGAQPSVPTTRVHATTDRGARVVLKEPEAHRDSGALLGPEAQVLENAHLDEQVIRRGGPTDESNCHGWVFTGGKFLLPGDEVDGILKDNGYHETREPQPGDVAVYRQNGAVAHTALVRYVTAGQPVLIEGKWGTMGVFLHPADKSVYGTDYTFYRSARSGHLLVGLDGGPTPHPEMPAVE